jgi:SAM-dependent methyltransferase
MPTENFDAYAAYYDLLYRDKEYDREAAFIDDLIKAYQPDAKRLLDLGCGTGIHDWILSGKGYQVVGVDRSESMLANARGRASLWPAITEGPQFSRGDLTTFRCEPQVDVVISLFDVMSYLTSYAQLRAALDNIKACLRPGGLLIFDCWYGPAVYTQQPGTRVKRLEDDNIRLTRIATADFDRSANRIDVHYEMFVNWKKHNRIETFTEVHPMRCYFDDELREILAASGFDSKFAMQWFTRQKPSDSTWSVLFGFQLAGASQ